MAVEADRARSGRLWTRGRRRRQPPRVTEVCDQRRDFSTSLVDQIAVTGKPTKLDLFVKDGLLWINDAAGPDACRWTRPARYTTSERTVRCCPAARCPRSPLRRRPPAGRRGAHPHRARPSPSRPTTAPPANGPPATGKGGGRPAPPPPTTSTAPPPPPPPVQAPGSVTE